MLFFLLFFFVAFVVLEINKTRAAASLAVLFRGLRAHQRIEINKPAAASIVLLLFCCCLCACLEAARASIAYLFFCCCQLAKESIQINKPAWQQVLCCSSFVLFFFFSWPCSKYCVLLLFFVLERIEINTPAAVASIVLSIVLLLCGCCVESGKDCIALL